MAVQRAIIDKMGGAIGANGIAPRTDIDKNMRMIERRQRTNAHEFACADAHLCQAGLVVVMGRQMVAHHIFPALSALSYRAGKALCVERV